MARRIVSAFNTRWNCVVHYQYNENEQCNLSVKGPCRVSMGGRVGSAVNK